MENLKNNVKFIRKRNGYVLHVKERGVWHPVDAIEVKEIYDHDKDKRKRKWYEWLWFPL